MSLVVAASWNHCPEGDGWSVWAMGPVPDRLAARLHRLPVGAVLNGWAGDLRHEMINLDQHLFPEGDQSWGACEAADRNPYTSDLPLALLTAVALVHAARQTPKLFVLIPDPTLAEALAATCRLAGLAVETRGLGRSRCRHAQALRAWAGLARAWAADLWRHRRRRRDVARVDGHPLWLVSWLSSGALPQAPWRDQDRYFGALPSWLDEGGHRTAVIGHPTLWLGGYEALVREVAERDGPLALVGAFLGPLARLRAVLAACRRSRRRRLHLGGVDVSPVLRRAWAGETGAGVARAALFAELGRAAAERKPPPDVLLYPYENQPWEKMLIAGFRRHSPATVLVGFQHTVFAEYYFSADPSQRQLAEKLVPDVMVVSGEAFRDRLVAAGFPADRIVLGGSLRAPEMAALAVSRPVPTALRTVLASLPMQADEGVELARKAATATVGTGMRLLLNFHPMLDEVSRQTIRTALADFDHVEFSDAPARALMDRADVLVYNSSGTVFEAASLGLPAIYVGPEAGLDLDKFPGGCAAACRSDKELGALLGAMAADPARIAAQVQHQAGQLARFFAPPDRARWEELIGRLVKARVSR